MKQEIRLQLKTGDHLILVRALTNYIDNYTKNISHLPIDDVMRICSQSWIDSAIELREQLYMRGRNE